MRYYAATDDDGPRASESVQSVLADVRDALRERAPTLSDTTTLLKLYGSITSLTARAGRIRTIVDDKQRGSMDAKFSYDSLTPAEVREFDGFHQELVEFGDALNAMSFAAIDIYYPGLAGDLLNVTGRDIDFSYVYTRDIAPRYGLTDRLVPPSLAALLDNYSGDFGPQNIGGKLLWECGSVTEEELAAHWGMRPDSPSSMQAAELTRIVDLLTSCRTAIAGIVRENWQFRDLLERPTEKEIRVEMTEYNITGSQVGAVGPGAHVHDVTFEQTNAAASQIDSAALAAELDHLREQLAQVASERDHYADLVAVSDAAADARQGRTGDALRKLSGVGKWVLDMASQIGVSVATEAIKTATGIG